MVGGNAAAFVVTEVVLLSAESEKLVPLPIAVTVTVYVVPADKPVIVEPELNDDLALPTRTPDA
jgi:hypothetical protein